MKQLLDGFEDVDAHIASMTVRTENHGDEVEPGLTIRMVCVRSNTILDEFAPGLRAALFTAETDQGELGLEDGYLPTQRFPKLGTLPWSVELDDYKVSIMPPGGRKGFTVGGCTLKKFSFGCGEGGSVTMTFNINCHPSEEVAGHLYALNGKDVEVAITGPDHVDEPEQADIDDAEA